MILAAGNALASALTSRSFASRPAWSYSWPMLHSAPHGEFASTSTVSCTLAFAFIFLSIFLFGYRCSLPNQSPEPMRGGAVSSASRLDVFVSRMAQLFSFCRFLSSIYFQRCSSDAFHCALTSSSVGGGLFASAAILSFNHCGAPILISIYQSSPCSIFFGSHQSDQPPFSRIQIPSARLVKP